MVFKYTLIWRPVTIRDKVKVFFFLSSTNSVSPFAYSVRFSEEKFCNIPMTFCFKSRNLNVNFT